MVMIRVEDLYFSVGTFSLSGVSLAVEEGEYFVLLGRTGAGKTLLLECLCGLNRVDRGRVEIGGADVTALEPRDRRIGYLPQDQALFPQMTVEGNVAFGLRVRRQAPTLIRERVAAMMELAGVAHLAGRRPEGLSGGEKQRVALARALAIQPKVLLLDEPVSAVDEQSRDHLCAELKRLHRAAGITTIHVCHNFSEMLAVADRAAVMEQGRIIQVGSPSRLLGFPESRFVAEFVQAGNIFAARAGPAGEMTRLECENGLICSSTEPASGRVTCIIRPENISLCLDRCQAQPEVENVFEASVEEIADRGALVTATVATASGQRLLVSMGKSQQRRLDVKAGDRVLVTFAAGDVHILPE